LVPAELDHLRDQAVGQHKEVLVVQIHQYQILLLQLVVVVVPHQQLVVDQDYLGVRVVAAGGPLQVLAGRVLLGKEIPAELAQARQTMVVAVVAVPVARVVMDQAQQAVMAAPDRQAQYRGLV
jgi:hypothetical protein